MNRLQKFVEQDRNGEKLGRTAYAFSRDKLPPPGENLDWNAAPSFNAAEELMQDTGLKDLFMTAIAEGFAVVRPLPD